MAEIVSTLPITEINTDTIIEIDSKLPDTQVDISKSITVEIQPDTYVLTSGGMYTGNMTGAVPTWILNAVQQQLTTGDGNLMSILDDMKLLLRSLQLGVHQTISQIENTNVSMSALETSLSSRIDANNAAILDVYATRVTATEAQAVAVQAIGATFGGNVDAYIGNLASVYTNATSATATNIATLQASYNEQNVRLDTIDQVISSADSWSASASKLITGPDGSITGWSFNDGSNVQSSFNIYAQNFSISDGVTGYTPFQINNGTVYIGEVDTSTPQITSIGSYASAPVATAVNQVYKNITNGNTYIWNGSSWVLWLTKGEQGIQGATGATGPRGYDGATGARGAGNFAGPASSAAWNSATANSLLSGLGLSPVNNDRVTLYYPSSNPTWSEIRYYSGGSWLTAALVVNGNAVVTGTLTADKIVANHIGAANSVRSSATIVSVGAMPAAITTGTLIAQLTYSNPTSTTVKLFVSALGRTGYYHAGALKDGSIGMSIMQGGSSLCDNGWTPAWQDTKAFGAVSAVAAHSSVTYYLYGQRDSSDSAWTCTAVMSLTVVGVANA